MGVFAILYICIIYKGTASVNRLGINVKTMFMLRIALCLGFLEGRTNSGLHFVKEGCAESIT